MDVNFTVLLISGVVYKKLKSSITTTNRINIINIYKKQESGSETEPWGTSLMTAHIAEKLAAFYLLKDILTNRGDGRWFNNSLDVI